MKGRNMEGIFCTSMSPLLYGLWRAAAGGVDLYVRTGIRELLVVIQDYVRNIKSYFRH